MYFLAMAQPTSSITAVKHVHHCGYGGRAASPASHLHGRGPSSRRSRLGAVGAVRSGRGRCGVAACHHIRIRSPGNTFRKCAAVPAVTAQLYTERCVRHTRPTLVGGPGPAGRPCLPCRPCLPAALSAGRRCNVTILSSLAQLWPQLLPCPPDRCRPRSDTITVECQHC